MSDLTEFLLARIMEDETDAPRWLLDRGTGDLDDLEDRVLRECEAKRRIVERHNDPQTAIHEDHGGQDVVTYCGHCGTELDEGDCPDLLDLASVYADHPDYLEEWTL